MVYGSRKSDDPLEVPQTIESGEGRVEKLIVHLSQKADKRKRKKVIWLILTYSDEKPKYLGFFADLKDKSQGLTCNSAIIIAITANIHQKMQISGNKDWFSTSKRAIRPRKIGFFSYERENDQCEIGF